MMDVLDSSFDESYKRKKVVEMGIANNEEQKGYRINNFSQSKGFESDTRHHNNQRKKPRKHSVAGPGGTSSSSAGAFAMEE